MSDASVRTARVQDAEAVGQVQAAVWQRAYADVVPAEVLGEFAPERFAQVWRDAIAQPPGPAYRLLVATEGDLIVGFAALGPATAADTSEDTVAELLTGGVHPDHRGRGHGSRLLNAVADTLAEGGFTELQVWVLGQAQQDRAFLQQAGFAPDSAWRDRVVSPEGTTAREVRLVAALPGDTGA